MREIGLKRSLVGRSARWERVTERIVQEILEVTGSL